MTANELAKATGATLARASKQLSHIEEAMENYDINTPARQAAFLAQIGHESGGLLWSTEIWGPTEAQKRYEGREDLGNTKRGDGARFKGHGWIQVTGRANHAAARDRLRDKLGDYVPDFEANPDQIATPHWAAMTAADYWFSHGCNELADAGLFKRLTRVINGGLNGYADRLARWETAKEVFA